MQSQSLYDAAQKDLERGFTVRGLTRLRQAAEMGHPGAAFTIALKIWQRIIPGSTKKIHTLLEQAGSHGHSDALLTLASITALSYPNREERIAELLRRAAQTGTKGKLIWVIWQYLHRNRPLSAEDHDQNNQSPTEADQPGLLDFLRSEACADKGFPASYPVAPDLDRLILSTPITIKVKDGFISSAECRYLQHRIAPTLRPSTIYDPHSGQRRPDPIRSGQATNFAPWDLDPMCAHVLGRICHYCDRSPETAEALAALRYRARERYRPHCDWLPPEALKNDPMSYAGQRIVTVLLYLNHVGKGGGTSFPKLSVDVIEPQPGRLLYFTNVNHQSLPEPQAQHAGEPVLDGEKWVLALWFRAKATHLYATLPESAD